MKNEKLILIFAIIIGFIMFPYTLLIMWRVSKLKNKTSWHIKIKTLN